MGWERERYREGSEAIWGLLAFCIYTTGFNALQKILLWTVSLCVSIGHTQRQNNSFNRSFECLLSVHISNLSLNSYSYTISIQKVSWLYRLLYLILFSVQGRSDLRVICKNSKKNYSSSSPLSPLPAPRAPHRRPRPAEAPPSRRMRQWGYWHLGA